METDRIYLRRWQLCDAEVLFKYASHPEVGPQAGWAPHKSVEESRHIISEVFGCDTMWAIVWKAGGEPIGCVGYLPAGRGNIAMGEHDGEVGYWIARPYWNKGICTEALQLVTDYCFNVKKLHTLWGSYFADNPASGRVMEKCGFTDTGKQSYCPHLYGGSERPVHILKLERPHANMQPIHTISIRPAREEDYACVLRINKDNVEVLSPMNTDRILLLASMTEQFLIAEVNGTPAAFIMTFREEAKAYDSENYQWFSTKYNSFLYVDRIAVAAPYRNMGVGSALYQAVYEHARNTHVPYITCEIDTIPYNEVSFHFHKKMGFHEVGTQHVQLNNVTVSLQECVVE